MQDNFMKNRIPVGWKGWENRNYKHERSGTVLPREFAVLDPMIKRGDTDWSPGKTKRYLAAPKLAKYYKWKLMRDLERNEDMEQILGMINVIMKNKEEENSP